MHIRLATLNVWALPEPIARDVQARIDAIGERLLGLDLDVIAFQEVWTRDAAKRLREAGLRAGLDHCWFGDDTFSDGGLLVLSRLAIDDVRFEPFGITGAPEKVAANLEYLSGKGFATIRLATPVGPFVLVNTHLHARYTRSSPHKHVPHRTGQTVQLAGRFIHDPTPMAAVGDFNFREGETDYRVLTEILGLTDVAAQLDNRQNTTLHANPYRRPDGVDRRKDFIFVRSGARHAVIPKTISRTFDQILDLDGKRGTYSDHAGLVTDLELLPLSETTIALSSAASPDPRLFEAAARMLAEGESLARERQEGSRKISGIGMSVAAAAALGAMPQQMSRRRLLRASLMAAALVALAPSLGLSIASEVLVPDEIQAFRDAASQLAALDSRQELAAVAAGPPA
jgi:endonuclease/exonuclease/phosphatase family metal-dependent hydrolase